MPNKINPLTGKFDYYQDTESTLEEAKAYADSIVLGLLDDRGSFTPAGLFPTTGGSGTDGTIMKGDVWYVTGLGTGVTSAIGSVDVKDGDTVRALTDTPGQTDANWDVMSSPVNAITVQTLINSRTAQTSPADTDNIPITDGVSGNAFKRLTWATLKSFFVLKNSSITGATKTKVTYDAKGLVTSGADATTADIAASTNKNYVTDAQAVVIGNTSGTNTGDETTATIKTKLSITTLSGSNTGDQDLSGLLVKSNNLSDLVSASTARTNLGLGTLATQNGTFSGTSSGTNTGDQDLSSYAPKASPTFTGAATTPAIIVSSETASTIASFDASKNIKSLSTATYPSLTELSYAKGVTSAIQTQIDAKLSKSGDTITGDIGNTSTGFFRIPSGTTAQRPVSPLEGMRRYNTTTARDEFYANGSWQNHARLSGDTFTGTISATNLSGTNTGDQTFLDARVQSVTSSATVTATSTNDLVKITAQAVNLTLANPTGTFTEGQALMIRIKDNATARTITFGAKFRAIGVTLPTTTVISKTMYLGVIYNSTDDTFDIVGLNQQA